MNISKICFFALFLLSNSLFAMQNKKDFNKPASTNLLDLNDDLFGFILSKLIPDQQNIINDILYHPGSECWRIALACDADTANMEIEAKIKFLIRISAASNFYPLFFTCKKINQMANTTLKKQKIENGLPATEEQREIVKSKTTLLDL